jgi:hypothetical protein
MNRLFAALIAGSMLIATSGCTTTAAKKALNKPIDSDRYSGFDPEAGSSSKRSAEEIKPVNKDEEPERAVTQLVEQLQQDRAHAISAEEQLKYWGVKQGVGRIVVSKVRPLLKHPKVEVRAPALRLTMLFGGPDANGDLIEALGDSEYGIRMTAYKALQTRTKRDFGYDPGGGEVGRARSAQEFRQWWQNEQRRTAVQPASVYEKNPVGEPKVIVPGE